MTFDVQILDDHFHDECGVFGVFGHPEAANLTYLGLYALQHRGQESAGIVASDGTELNFHRAMGEVEEIFTPAVLAKLPGHSAIGHTRYSTAGDKALLNAQPIMIDCNKGKIAVGHNGNLTNAADWRRKLEHRGSIFQTNSDTEVIVHLIARSQARNLSGALGDALNQVEGAYSLLVLTQDGRVAKQLIGGHSDVDKEYLVRVKFGEHEVDIEPHFPPESLALLRHGLSLDDVPLKTAQVSWQNGEQLRFVLREGKKRQIRRMCELVGLEVVGLKRIRMGRVTLGALPPGQWRYLGADEAF